VADFGWDPPKSERNTRERGLPFEIAMALFDGNTIEFDDMRKDYGERRIIAYSEVAGRVFVYVYTWRGTVEAPLNGSSACAGQILEKPMPTASRSRNKPDLSKVDWRRVDATTDDEIARQASQDPDTAPVSSADEILSLGRRVARGDIEDVRALRIRLDLSQERFAARFGFSVDAVRQYESRRRTPTGPARTLLRVIACEPDAVARALADDTR
jgi:DNA-binding transcriptional regulator YiaG/uncharacterized DUF497 family protein